MTLRIVSCRVAALSPKFLSNVRIKIIFLAKPKLQTIRIISSLKVKRQPSVLEFHQARLPRLFITRRPNSGRRHLTILRACWTQVAPACPRTWQDYAKFSVKGKHLRSLVTDFSNTGVYINLLSVGYPGIKFSWVTLNFSNVLTHPGIKNDGLEIQ